MQSESALQYSQVLGKNSSLKYMEEKQKSQTNCFITWLIDYGLHLIPFSRFENEKAVFYKLII